MASAGAADRFEVCFLPAGLRGDAARGTTLRDAARGPVGAERLERVGGLAVGLHAVGLGALALEQPSAHREGSGAAATENARSR